MKEIKDIEDAIYAGLLEGESTYNRLFHLIQKYKECALATFDKHLKNMVKAGIINRKAAKKGQQITYWIDPTISTKARNLEDTTEQNTKKWDEQIDVLQAFVDSYKKLPKKEMKILEMMPVLYDRFINSIVNWYNFSIALSFLGTSGFLPKVTEKKINKIHEAQLKKIESILNQMKAIDPVIHNKLCIRMGSKMGKD